MRRFFAERVEDGIAYFSDEELAHISRVLRMTPGDLIIVPEGHGEWICKLEEADGKLVARLIEYSGCDAEPKNDIALYLAYTKSDKLELCVQKAVELGVSRIIPFISSRCVRIPDEKSAEKSNLRFLRIAHEAVKQCGRATDISITMPIRFNDFLEEIENEDCCIFAYEKSDIPLKQFLKGKNNKKIGLIIGPEGGFSEEEAEKIEKKGAHTVSLGTRILRAETAAIALMAIVSYETEN